MTYIVASILGLRFARPALLGDRASAGGAGPDHPDLAYLHPGGLLGALSLFHLVPVIGSFHPSWRC